MDCKTAQNMVKPYIKRELNSHELEAFLTHIKNCKECEEELEIYYTIHFALRKLDEEHGASYNINKMLMDDLQSSRRYVKRAKLIRVCSCGLMLLAEIILVVVLLVQLGSRDPGEPKQQEAAPTLYPVNAVIKETE